MDAAWTVAFFVSTVTLSGWVAYALARRENAKMRDLMMRERRDHREKIDTMKQKVDETTGMNLVLAEKVIKLRKRT